MRGVFEFVLIAIALIIVLAFLLRVAIPGALLGLFLKIIFVVGFFKLFSKTGK